ncbi:hypothetical protein BZB76_1379 [Actinomadura pelletieri DSM 43383]|uniref:Uncharacterized protein n=1 Tax=Actinomadura pelletieri DSM 43383 TaxID=1120940 RepID=A0A495R1A0_9ACTN|nr:hypothetical protein [Actinomadura pelletieri]RKS79896.1 hypothetical protein BZB76_1379 [Actinomadura pelletieri DSM 43383]
MWGFIGVIMMIQGFGSAIARMFSDDAKFGFLLKWAHDYQPFVGIATGILGIGVLLLGERGKSAKGG